MIAIYSRVRENYFPYYVFLIQKIYLTGTTTKNRMPLEADSVRFRFAQTCCQHAVLLLRKKRRNVWILKVEISDFNWLNIQRAALSYTLLQMPIHSRHADLVEQCWYDYKQAQDCQQRTPEKLQMMSRTLKEILMVANSQLCCQGSLSSGIPG